VLNTLRFSKVPYCPENFVSGGSGCGNNWAAGYTTGEHILSAAEERIRREAENCDLLSSIVLFHSAAGGTGSGNQ